MPNNLPSPQDLDAERAHWTGLDPLDLRELERAPLDPRVGFDVPERVEGTEEVPAVASVLAVLAVLGDDGVPVAFDGAFGGEAVRAIGARVGSQARDARGEEDAPFVRSARRLAEAAGLIERRMGRVRLTAAGRRLAADGPETLLPLLLRAWARRPLEGSGRFAEALHATWPLTVLLLRRFGDDWLSPRFYAAVVAGLTPAAIATAPGKDDDEAHQAFFDAFVVDVVLRFAAFLGLVDLGDPEDADDGNAEPTLRATWLLDALLPLSVEQAPAADALDDEDAEGEGAVSDLAGEIGDALAEREFDSDEERDAFVAGLIAERNAAPLDEFDGLSADDMWRLLQDPFGSDGPLVVADVPRAAPRSALLHLVLDLAEALGDAGLKATAKGNLPRAHALAALERYREAGWRVSPYLSVRSELDFAPLHVARLVARMAGLVTLRSGHWHATRALRRTLDRSGAAGVYAALFRAFVTKYAWNSADGYPALDIIQASWAYSLLQLLRHGATWRDGGFYADRFVRAFPRAVDEAAVDLRWRSWQREPHDVVGDAYELRVLERFADFLGLVEIERGASPGDYGRVVRVRAAPALAELVAERTLS
ncbi:MAG: hypothetical protein ACNA8N_12290 [Trueperaceae bacterium]